MKYEDICLDVEKIINDEINKLKLSYQLEEALLHKPICKGFFSDIIFK